MSLKRRWKKAFRRFVGDFTDVSWKDLDHKKVYGAAAVLLFVIVLVIVLIVNLLKGGKDGKVQQPEGNVQEDLVQPDEISEQPEETLEKDAYPQINALLEKYFQGISSGDIGMVEETVDVLSEEEKQVIERKKDYIESYDHLICYTRKGMEEGSFVVFAAYEMKIYNIETAAPGIMPFYVCQAEDGSYYIYNQEASEEMQAYVLELASEEETAAIIADIEARYQQLLAEDEDLGNFAETMLGSQEADETPDETAEAPQETDETPDEVTEAPADENADATAVNKQMQFKEAVRIRADRSSESERLTNAYKSDLVMVIENYSDGWSKVNYNDIVGYCKTEFLEETQ